jgi:hypothetical protein
MGDSYDRAYVAYMKMAREAIYLDNEDCVKDVLNSPYWRADERIQKKDGASQTKYLILGIAIAVIFILALFLFIRYYHAQLALKNEGTEDFSAEAPRPAKV